MLFALNFEVRSNFLKLNYIRTAKLIKLTTKKELEQKKKHVMRKMAQAKENCSIIHCDILSQLQAPEALKPQVLVKEAAVEKEESQLIKKKLWKLFRKGKTNARITKELKSIKGMKANLDSKVMSYRNYQINF